MAKIIDLSKPIQPYPDEPRSMRIKVKHYKHKRSEYILRKMGLFKRNYPKGFHGWADDTITSMPVHGATHMDAPWHYGAKLGNGEKAKTIDEIPLEWCYGDGVLLDFTHKSDMEIITKEELKIAVKQAGVHIAKGTIVLIRTGNDRLIGTKEYETTGTGVSGEATEWLIDRGVHMMGIDQWGWDLPLEKTVKRIRDGADPETLWEGHRIGSKKEYCHIEQVVGLDKLPVKGFKVSAFPLPLKGCSASPVRLVAIIDDE